MSIDQRIREGLTMIDQELPHPDLHAAHDMVVQEGRRLTRRKRTLGVGLAAAAVLAALFAARVAGGPDEGRDRVPAQDPTPSLGGVPASPIEGVYRSRPVSFTDMAATLREAGLAADVEPLRSRLGGLDHRRLRLTLRDGESLLRVPGTDIALRQDYTLSTDVIQMETTDRATWRTTMGITLSAPASDRVGMGLVLTLLDSAGDPLSGAGSEAWMRALFTTTMFQEISD